MWPAKCISCPSSSFVICVAMNPLRRMFPQDRPDSSNSTLASYVAQHLVPERLESISCAFIENSHWVVIIELMTRRSLWYLQLKVLCQWKSSTVSTSCLLTLAAKRKRYLREISLKARRQTAEQKIWVKYIRSGTIFFLSISDPWSRLSVLHKVHPLVVL